MDESLILGRYRPLERLAAGGSAEVWRARDEQLRRDVAIKRLHPHLMPDEASRKRLVAEAHAAAGLSHPVIVEIYDVDDTGESPALVMELVDGESLAARIGREGPLPASEGTAIAADIAEALFHAHQLGVIHRDVKPGNVLLSADGRTRLVDFGIAHSLAAASERLTTTGTVIGTLHAMAPEQLAAGPITPRTDLYGVGAVLHESLTGRPPYAESSPVALADAQRVGPPRMDGIDPALAAAIAGCLAFEPADRPLHAGALADALRAWLAGDPAPALALARTGAPVDPSAQTLPRLAVPAAAPPPPPAEPGRTRWRMGRAAWLLAAALALVVVAAFVAAALGPNAEEPRGAGADATSTLAPTPTATPTAAPTASPEGSSEPEWLAGLVEDVREACDDEAAAEAATEMSTMSRGQSKKHAREMVKECDEDGDG
jgi:tRNA A-37 threonylcarbamoyl transferase component Bud32